jgi:hypothetical protein
MDTNVQSINLDAVIANVWHAIGIVVCTVGFEAAVHGLILACLIGLLGLYLRKQKHKTGVPLLAVFRKLSIFCILLMIPGLIALSTAGQLPHVGSLKLPSIGLFAFWSLILVHLTAEEMNFQWF